MDNHTAALACVEESIIGCRHVYNIKRTRNGSWHFRYKGIEVEVCPQDVGITILLNANYLTSMNDTECRTHGAFEDKLEEMFTVLPALTK